MADWFVGKAAHCSDANGGTTWADAKLTITSLLTVAYGNGDRLLVGPGVYRETVTLNGSGGNTYAAGTVDVTNESTAVTGNGTGFAAGGVVAGDQLFIGNFATAADGVGNTTLLFTTAASTPFQTNMEGFMIEIIGEGAYIIDTVNANNSIDLLDVNGVGFPAAGGGLTFYVVSGEGPYEIAGGIAAATLTLSKPWSGPTLTVMTYIIYRPVYLIADTTGVETDGVGGVVRITGTDDDETKTRNEGIYADTRNYWVIRGFRIDCCDSESVYVDTCTYMTFEDLSIMDYTTQGFEISDSTQITIRRTVILGGASHTGYSIDVWAGVNIDNGHILVENVYATGGALNISIADIGGSTIKNYTSGFRSYWNIKVGSVNAGAAVFVHDCLLHFTSYEALDAWALGELVEQHNNLWSNGIDRSANVGTAANSTAYCYLPSLPLLGDGTRWPTVAFFAPSEWEPTRAAAGLYGKNEDMFGVHNEVAQTRRSWGAQHHYPTKRETTVAYGAFAAAQAEPDAMEQQHYWNVQEDRTYTITVQVDLDAGYTGNNPQMTVSQPGQADVVATSTGAKGSWEQLTVTFTTGSALDWIGIFLKSRNTSALANKSVRWQDLDVR